MHQNEMKFFFVKERYFLPQNKRTVNRFISHFLQTIYISFHLKCIDLFIVFLNVIFTSIQYDRQYAQNYDFFPFYN